jgi:hypothetical protein
MICSSLNRDNLIVPLLPVNGLYSNLEEIWGLIVIFPAYFFIKWSSAQVFQCFNIHL